MSRFHIATPQGPAPVDGLPYMATIGGRRVLLFIHTESELEGPRLSCARSGLKLGNIAPHMLARFVSTGHSDGPLSNPKVARLGAALLLRSTIDRVGAEKVLRVLDAAPALEIVKGESHA